MESNAFFSNEKIISKGQKIENCFYIKSGSVTLNWKWDTWEPLVMESGHFIGLIEMFNDLESPFEAIVKIDSEIITYNREEINNLKDFELRFKLLKSITVLNSEIIQQKYMSLRSTPEEMMHMAFETFVHDGDKQRAIDTYAKFISFYPNSPYVDNMLQVIQSIYLDQNVDTNIPENEEDAFEHILTRINSSDPQENIIHLKDFERKFPKSEHMLEVLHNIISEYEKLEDEYQLNYYIKKLLFHYPETDEAMKAMFCLISHQRRTGEPEWYENAIRFYLMFPDSKYIDILDKYMGRNNEKYTK